MEGLAQVIAGDQTPDKAGSWKRKAFAVGVVGEGFFKCWRSGSREEGKGGMEGGEKT